MARQAGLDDIPNKDDENTAGVDAEDTAVLDEEDDEREEGAESDEDEDGEEGEHPDAATGKITPKMQKILDKRIAKEVTKRKTLEEAKAEAETKLAELNEEVESLRETRNREELEAAFSMGVEPAYLTKPENELLARHTKLEANLEWLEDHEEGYEGPGANGASIEWSAEQVRKMHREVERDLRKIDLDARDVRRRAMKQQLEDQKRGRELRLKEKLDAAKGKTPKAAAKAKEKARREAAERAAAEGEPGEGDERIPAGGTQPRREREPAGTTGIDAKAIAEADDPAEEYRRQQVKLASRK